MTKVDLTKSLFDLDGSTPIMDGPSPLILKTILRRILALPSSPEQNLSPDDHVKRFELSVELISRTSIEFDNEQITLLKKLVSKNYNTLVAAQVIRLLEGKDAFPNTKMAVEEPVAKDKIDGSKKVIEEPTSGAVIEEPNPNKY